MNPKITVFMPVYNGEKYLEETLQSILNQTFTDFEFLIIDDCSSDDSFKILQQYKNKDSRINLIRNEHNIGIANTTNKGIYLAKGKYIALTDHDDISLPKRLEEQFNFMEKHPSIGICGTYAKVIEKDKKPIKKSFFINPDKIKTFFLFGVPFFHPTLMLRKKCILDNNLKYDSDYRYTSDYKFLIDASSYFPITNIKKFLFLYRIHSNNTSKTKSEICRQSAQEIKKYHLKQLCLIPSKEEFLIHQSVYMPNDYEIKFFLDKAEQWFLKLIKQNKKTGFSKEKEFSMVIAQRYLRICNVNANYNWQIWKRFWQSPLRKKLDFKEWQNWKILFRFFTKCLLKKPKI